MSFHLWCYRCGADLGLVPKGAYKFCNSKCEQAVADAKLTNIYPLRIERFSDKSFRLHEIPVSRGMRINSALYDPQGNLITALIESPPGRRVKITPESRSSHHPRLAAYGRIHRDNTP